MGRSSGTGAFDLGAHTFTGNQTAPALISSGLTGAVAASRYVGATASGAPTSGTFAVGDFVFDQSGSVYVCVTAGTPGTWKVLRSFSGCRVVNNGGVGQSINSATWTAILWTTADSLESYDTDSYHDPSSNSSRFTVPTNGWYMCWAHVSYPNQALGWVGLNVYVDGAAVAEGPILNQSTTSNDNDVHCTAVVYCTAGQYIEFFTLHNKGSAATVNTYRRSATVVRLG